MSANSCDVSRKHRREQAHGGKVMAALCKGLLTDPLTYPFVPFPLFPLELLR
jgi:hypothetical protein